MTREVTPAVKSEAQRAVAPPVSQVLAVLLVTVTTGITEGSVGPITRLLYGLRRCEVAQSLPFVYLPSEPKPGTSEFHLTL